MKPPRPSPLLRSVRDRLRAAIVDARLRLALSQEELAERAGMSKGYLSQIESGKRLPSLPVLLSVAEALGKSVRDLF